MLSCFSHVQLCAILWAAARLAPLSMGILWARILEWVAMPSSRESSQPRDQSCVLISTALADRFFTTSAYWRAPI